MKQICQLIIVICLAYNVYNMIRKDLKADGSRMYVGLILTVIIANIAFLVVKCAGLFSELGE